MSFSSLLDVIHPFDCGQIQSKGRLFFHDSNADAKDYLRRACNFVHLFRRPLVFFRKSRKTEASNLVFAASGITLSTR